MRTAVLGYPRIGKNRELKKAVEDHWKGNIGPEALEEAGRGIRRENWLALKNAGIDVVPSNDFSFYDTVLDTIALTGAVPERYGWKRGSPVDLKIYFAMARGLSKKNGAGPAVTAMEMTKWFDTNYHYIVPEFRKGRRFSLSGDKPFREFKEARALGIGTRPVLLGPVTFLLLGKKKGPDFGLFGLLDSLIPVYVEILKRFAESGAGEVQIDEPAMALDLDGAAKAAFTRAYRAFAKEAPGAAIHLASYFGPYGPNLALAASLPVKGLHFDLVRGASDAPRLTAKLLEGKAVSLGLVDGRNVWKNDLRRTLAFAQPIVRRLGAENCVVASSCSLLHAPLSLESETKIDPKVKAWLAFAGEKTREITLLRGALSGDAGVRAALAENARALALRRRSRLVRNAAVRRRLARLRPSEFFRRAPFRKRELLQHEVLGLPVLPTTTIGSFPQTSDVRAARAEYRQGKLRPAQYESFLKDKIRDAIRRQEKLGLDVLVHGEFERNDMVEFFGENLAGFVFSENGWVQSYGTRCVKPPILYGDVERRSPMTLKWTRYAQSLTRKPVKGMLTGPITILQWSFVRDDQERSVTANQIALAIRDEARDLERGGARIIQIDEPALREGLPLRKAERARYLKWAVRAFRLSSSGVDDRTQIHTHMCYGEFADVIGAIAALDADVISIETSRSQMELLDVFAEHRYPNEIGPGVYDVHSPRVPAESEIKTLIGSAAEFIPPERLWVNPDCGLKTRGWEETELSLKAMVRATRTLRSTFSKKSS